MAEFDEVFSETNVIEVLCRLRVRLSKVRHDALFHRRLSARARAPKQRDPFEEHFPGRKQWHSFRPAIRGTVSSDDLKLKALRRAVFKLRVRNPSAPWVHKMASLVAAIQQSALKSTGHSFSHPRISAQQKAPGSHDYRPIASFDDERDKVIDSLVARYLRERLDIAFEPCSVAFRTRQRDNSILDRESAVTAILEFRKEHNCKPLVVAECDIRGFYDCVSHATARVRLGQAIEHAQARCPNVAIDERAIQTFESYLRCYSFPSSVKSDELGLRMRVKDPKATYKWPDAGENSLTSFYANPASESIGVPQGGALSCFISNLVLDYADKEVCLAAQRTGRPVRYFRYCDDMVIITTDQSACQVVFQAYLCALSYLRLPFHKPDEWIFYGPNFYEKSKTKAPYVWHGRTWFNHSPWIQFLGYQFRYDGLLRIRKKSLIKHRLRVREILEEVMAGVHRKHSRVNRGRLLYRFHQKLIAISVGRASLPSNVTAASSSRGPMNKCWAAGFRGFHQRPFVAHPLRAFDRLRTAAKRILGEKTAGLKLIDRTDPTGIKIGLRDRIYYGYPFSYSGQFKNEGGNKLIRSPYRPDAVDKLVLLPCYRSMKSLDIKKALKDEEAKGTKADGTLDTAALLTGRS